MNWKKRLVLVLNLFSLGILMAAFYTLFATFMMAYFSPTKSVLVCIDLAHEAHFEFILITISAILIPIHAVTQLHLWGKK